LLAALGGALLSSAFSIRSTWPLVFLAIGCFVLSLEWSKHRADAAFSGAVFGWVAFVGGYHWMQPTLVLFWQGRVALSWTVWLAWALWVSLRFVAVAWIYVALRRRGLGIVTSLTLPWLVVESLYPALFPFYLGNTLVDQSILIQVVALGGVLLPSAWICGVGALLAELVLFIERRRPVPTLELSIVLAGTCAVLLYGWVSTRSVATMVSRAPEITVGVVQANVDVMHKRTERTLSHRRHLAQSLSLESEGPVDLLVWPETSYLRALPHALPVYGGTVRDELETPLLFGGIRKYREDGRDLRFNSAMLIGKDGWIRSAYDKRFLIPFAEFVPFEDSLGSWADLAPTMSRFRRGTETSWLQFGPWRIATPICYETIRPGYVRELVRHSKPHLLVSLTNDGWFGDSPEPHLHLLLARLRAIEHRRYLVRATNTGISAIVDPMGRIVAKTDVFETASLRHPVHLLDGPTVYGVLGNWPGYSSILALLALVLIRKPGAKSEG
jgi:apolipoprotein N-acyltransferase